MIFGKARTILENTSRELTEISVVRNQCFEASLCMHQRAS